MCVIIKEEMYTYIRYKYLLFSIKKNIIFFKSSISHLHIFFYSFFQKVNLFQIKYI